MSFGFPVFLNLEDQPCLVLGGGTVGEGKVTALLEAGARVTLISPTATAALTAAAVRGHLRWIPRVFAAGDLAGYLLAIAATNDRQVNAAAWKEAQERKVLFNAVDDPPNCGFIFPAVHRQGDLTVAVSTGGKSPALAARLRDRLAEQLGPEYGDLLDALGEARLRAVRRWPDTEERKRAIYAVVDAALKSLEEPHARASFHP